MLFNQHFNLCLSLLLVSFTYTAAGAAAGTDSSTPRSTSNTVNPLLLNDSGSAILNSASTSSGIGLHNSGTDGTFPGVGAGVDVLSKYFATPSGVRFLQQPEYEAAYNLFNNDLLEKVLHR